MDLKEVSEFYRIRENLAWQKNTNEWFTREVNATPELKALRDWVETNIFGFGERSFYWLFKLVVDEMPKNFRFLEVGVFRGQTLALVAKLAQIANKEANITGITPLDSSGGHWESDYGKDIEKIHQEFKLHLPFLIIGLSTNETVIEMATESDIVYIDGGHDYETVKSDLLHYTKLAKTYLIIDDCCNDIEMPWGYFTGIESVTQAVNEWEATQTEFELLFNIVHIKIYKRK